MCTVGYCRIGISAAIAHGPIILMRLFTPEEAERVANSVQAVTCSSFHDGPCLKFWSGYFAAAFLQSLKFYIPLQFLPLLLRIKQLKKE